MTPEQFLVFADPLPEPMLLVSGGVVLAVNRAAGEHLGLALRGNSLSSLVADSPDEIVRYLRFCARSRNIVPGAMVFRGPNGKGIACRVEGTLLCPRVEGSEAVLMLRLIPKESAVGKFVALNQRIDELAREIQRRRQAEEAARQAEERFRILADSIPQLVWSARPDGHIFWYNQRWYQYTGTTPEQMEGWGWQRVHDPAVLPAVMERWKASVAMGEPFEMVFPLRGADGKYRPFLTRVLPLKDRDGRVIQWFGTNTDIGEQQAMENLLREGDRRKNEFLATLAHELRNPLAPLCNGLQIIEFAADDPAAVDQARKMMERQLHLMVRLVDDLLDLSRISWGKIELRRERIELSAVVSSAIETSDPLIKQCGHELTVTLPDQPVFVDADKTRLAQALSNLLNNAAKYSDRGSGIWLTVEQDGGEAILRVKDNGVGIPPDMLPRVFDMFAQVDRTLDRAKGGLGIGLAIVKQLIELHGGRVEARSEGNGKGSEFLVRLPVVPAAVPESPTAIAGEPTQSPLPCRILVVDDNEDVARSLAAMLTMMGNEVRTAHDGLAGVVAASAFRPDMILLDIGMPKLNGYDTCRRIREQPWGKNIVIVALTGWGQEEDKRQSREAGFNHHLIKPIRASALEKPFELVARRKA